MLGLVLFSVVACAFLDLQYFQWREQVRKQTSAVQIVPVSDIGVHELSRNDTWYIHRFLWDSGRQEYIIETQEV